MISKDLLKEHFPFDIPNPGQMEAIEEATFSIYEGGKRHIIIEAPTGIGKSAIAMTIHKVLKAAYEKRFRTTIITSTKGLQDQYKAQFPEIDNLMGKTNYTCPHGVGPYSSIDCKLKVKAGCKPEKECPYFMARSIWMNTSNLRLTNHSFQIEACPQICMTEENIADMIVIDECHEAEMNIINHSILKLSVADFNTAMSMRLIKDLKHQIALCVQALQGENGSVFVSTVKQRTLLSSLKEMCKATADELIVKAMNANENRNMLALYSDLINEVNTLQDRADLFCSTIDGTWLRAKSEDGKFVEIKPVFASQVAHYGLFRKAKIFVHMSSTICGLESYKKSLGLDNEDCHYIKIDNPIPLQNRPIKVYPNHKVSGGFSDHRGLAADIDLICDHHKDDSGIIHTVSFDLANKIINNSQHKKRMVVSNDRREIIRHLSTQNGIILSPSLEKGFDAKDDLSRFQILPKVPYAFLGDPLVSYNSKKRGDWYAREAILRIVQASGRSVRGPTDYADTYILDSNFLRLYKENNELFPEWFLEAVEIN